MLALRLDDNLLTCLLSKACPICTVATRWQWGAAQLADCTRTLRMTTVPFSCSSSMISSFAFVSRKRFENRVGPSLGSSRVRFGAAGRRDLSFAIARRVSFASVASSTYKPVAMHLSATTDPHICATRRRNGHQTESRRRLGAGAGFSPSLVALLLVSLVDTKLLVKGSQVLDQAQLVGHHGLRNSKVGAFSLLR